MADSLTTLVAIVAFLAFIGNVLITIVGLKLPTHPKNLTQIFLISLSIADILLSLQVPFYVLGLQDDERDRFTPNPAETSTTLRVFCSISSFLLWTTVKANIFMVMVMGFDRMAATCYAATYLKKVKRQYAFVACGIVWVLSVILAGLPGVIAAITKDSNPYSYDKRFRTCTPFPDFCEGETGGKPRGSLSHFVVYFQIELVLSFILPLLCIIVCYFLICSKIFNLKKIRTISRHFSKRQLFKSGKHDKNKHSKSSTPEEGSIKDNHKSFEKESNASFAMITSEEHSLEADKKPAKSFRINLNQTAEQHEDEMSVYPIDNKPPGFRINVSTSAPARQPRFGLYTSRVSNECGDGETSGKPISLYPDTTDMVEECGEGTDQSPEPKQYPIDPSLQRRRFNFFSTAEDDQFAECPEPNSNQRNNFLTNSINVIEKHYNAIEAAQKELAKKMRVYKFQIRVARTAVVVCTFFFICYLAYEIGTLYIIWEVDCSEENANKTLFIKMCHLFLFVNSALNVLVYGLMHRTVRAHLSKICAACTGKPTSSST